MIIDLPSNQMHFAVDTLGYKACLLHTTKFSKCISLEFFMQHGRSMKFVIPH